MTFPVIANYTIEVAVDELADQISYPYWPPARVFTSNGFNFNPIIRSRKLETEDKTRFLFHEGGTISQGSPESLEQITDVSDYTVTTDKTAKVILILESNSGNCQFKVWQTDSADDVSTGSPVTKYTYAGTDFDDNQLMTVCPEWDVTEKTFAAGKYITIEVTSGGTSLEVVGAVVIES
jgi:hypothetical protein